MNDCNFNLMSFSLSAIFCLGEVIGFEYAFIVSLLCLASVIVYFVIANEQVEVSNE